MEDPELLDECLKSAVYIIALFAFLRLIAMGRDE